MTDDHSTDTQQPPPTPNVDLKRLERLVGTWNVSGGAQGRATSRRRSANRPHRTRVRQAGAGLRRHRQRGRGPDPLSGG
jgi:hypothetical protein